MAPLAKQSLSDGLVAHMAAALQVDPQNSEEMNGVEAMAAAALDYFKSSVRGAPPGSLVALMWTICSALWEEDVDQSEIDKFFSDVQIDVGALFETWMRLPVHARSLAKLTLLPANINVRGLTAAVASLPPDQQCQALTVAVIPGDLRDADIADIVSALYRQRTGPSLKAEG